MVSVAEKHLLPFEKSLPSTEINRLHVTAELLEDTENFLREMVDRHAFESYSRKFFNQSGIRLEFSSNAQKIATNIAAERGISISGYLAGALRDFEYGLKLIGKSKFTVTKNLLMNPQEYLDKLIKQSYKNKKQ